jgi:hypothetical protein
MRKRIGNPALILGLFFSLVLTLPLAMLAQEFPFGKVIPRPTPADKDKENKEPSKPPEAPAQTIQRVAQAHGGLQARRAVQDSVANGTVTYFTPQGPGPTFDISVTRKGSKVQRLVRQPGGEVREGSNGETSWQSGGGFTMKVTDGPVARFIATQTSRSVDSLLDFQARGLALREADSKGNFRVVEIEESPSGRASLKTRYVVDDASSLVTEIQFVVAEAKDMFGNPAPQTETWKFSDYRNVSGVLEPFRIERYINKAKIEETQLQSIRHNTSVEDHVFKP